MFLLAEGEEAPLLSPPEEPWRFLEGEGQKKPLDLAPPPPPPPPRPQSFRAVVDLKEWTID